MNKYLLMTFILLTTGAWAQAYPTQRVHYDQYQADIQPTVIDDHHAVINVNNPNGSEGFRMDVQEHEGQVNVVTRDKAGRVIGTVDGVENQYLNSLTDVNGVRNEMHLKQLGNEEITGTMAYSNRNTGEEISANLLGDGMGMLNQTKQGYKMALSIRGEDSATVTYTKAATNEIICIVDDNNRKARVYNAQKKVIAEGMSDDDTPSKIYDKAAYTKCERVMEIFDDDDDDE